MFVYTEELETSFFFCLLQIAEVYEVELGYTFGPLAYQEFTLVYCDLCQLTVRHFTACFTSSGYYRQ